MTKPGQRYKHGWVKIYPEISKADLSTPDARRSREVSPQEFQRLAATGAAEYQKLTRAGSPTTGLDKNWGKIINSTFAEARKDWGGATIDAHTGEALPQGADKYALTVRDEGMPTVSIRENASIAEYRKAMNTAKSRYSEILKRQDHHLGIFHDNDKHTIDIDPVFVTGKKSHTETIGAYKRSVGGAYHFKSGDGFWPPHVKES